MVKFIAMGTHRDMGLHRVLAKGLPGVTAGALTLAHLLTLLELRRLYLEGPSRINSGFLVRDGDVLPEKGATLESLGTGSDDANLKVFSHTWNAK